MVESPTFSWSHDVRWPGAAAREEPSHVKDVPTHRPHSRMTSIVLPFQPGWLVVTNPRGKRALTNSVSVYIV
jgi:hypothetical protein